MQGFFSGGGGIVLLLRLSRENAQDCEVVLDLLKSCKSRLAVIRNAPIIGGDGRLFRRAPPSGVKQRLRKTRTNCPEAAGPGEPVGGQVSLKSCQGAQVQRGIVSSLSNTNLFIGGSHPPLARRYVRSALQQLRRQYLRHCGDGWRMKINGAGGQAEVCRGLADKYCDRMLILSALNRDVCIKNLGVFQLSASLRYIRFRCSSALEPVFGKFERLAVGLHCIVEQLFLGVSTAEFKIAVCEISL